MDSSEDQYDLYYRDLTTPENITITYLVKDSPTGDRLTSAAENYQPKEKTFGSTAPALLIARTIMIDWLRRLLPHPSLSSASVHNSIEILDHFLRLGQLTAENMLTIAVAALLISSKWFDDDYLTLPDIVHGTLCTSATIVKMELSILDNLNWKIEFENPYMYLTSCELPLHILKTAVYICEIIMMSSIYLSMPAAIASMVSIYIAKTATPVTIPACRGPWTHDAAALMFNIKKDIMVCYYSVIFSYRNHYPSARDENRDLLYLYKQMNSILS